MDEPLNGFTCSVVCFGDHLELAKRCLASIVYRLDPALVHSLRVGLNAVSPAVRDYVRKRLADTPQTLQTLIYDCGGDNRYKYPLLRRMIRDQEHPVITQFVMHFDDDSAVAPESDKSWWTDVYTAMHRADMIGQLWAKRAEVNQLRAIARQTWYKHVPLRPGHRFKFATGGWWVIRTSVLQQYNWPLPEIKHRGGDCLLGELFRQQGLRLVPFDKGVWINADAEGHASKSPRRGFDEPPVFSSYDPHKPVDISHQRFELAIYDPKQHTEPLWVKPTLPSKLIRLPL